MHLGNLGVWSTGFAIGFDKIGALLPASPGKVFWGRSLPIRHEVLHRHYPLQLRSQFGTGCATLRIVSDRNHEYNVNHEMHQTLSELEIHGPGGRKYCMVRRDPRRRNDRLSTPERGQPLRWRTGQG